MGTIGATLVADIDRRSRLEEGKTSRAAGREVSPLRSHEKRRGANLPRRSAGMPPRSHNNTKRCQLI
jgi:hypothetical protein